jgi:hypothetical protein
MFSIGVTLICLCAYFFSRTISTLKIKQTVKEHCYQPKIPGTHKVFKFNVLLYQNDGIVNILTGWTYEDLLIQLSLNLWLKPAIIFIWNINILYPAAAPSIAFIPLLIMWFRSPFIKSVRKHLEFREWHRHFRLPLKSASFWRINLPIILKCN